MKGLHSSCRTLIPPMGIQNFRCSSSLSTSLKSQINVWKTNNAGLSYTSSQSTKEENDSKETLGWYGDEGRNIRVSVWWDFENCSVPVGVSVYKVVPRILAALRTSGIKGPMTICGYGDILQLSRSTQEALTATGICLSHVPRGGKNSADRALLVDLVLWASQNPPPAHLFLISGDGDFSSILHRLRMQNYNILLANSDTSSAALCNAASIVWQWNRIMRGKGLLGKQYNHPPDGIPCSWYGQPIGPVEDVFRDVDLRASNDTVPELSEGIETESSQELDPKPRLIPRTVMTQIAYILNSYPQGLSIQQLQSEIAKHDIEVDKDFFGHKKFLQFLIAMPNTLKLHRRVSSDGKTWIYYAYPKSTESSKSKARPSSMEPADGKRLERAGTDGEAVSSAPKSVLKEHALDKESPLSGGIKETHTDGSSGQSSNINGQRSQQQESFLGRILRNWFGKGLSNDSGNVDDSNNGNLKTKSKDAEDRNDRSDGVGADVRNLNDNDPSSPEKISKASAETKLSFSQWLFKSSSHNSSSPDIGLRSHLKENVEVCSKNSQVNSSSSPSIFKWFSQDWKGWLPSLRGNFSQTSLCHADFVSSPKKISADCQGRGTCDRLILSQSEDAHIFSKPEFWHNVKNYLRSNRGSAVVSKAKSSL
eukprot:Gb_38160 [translate_table: standard]